MSTPVEQVTPARAIVVVLISAIMLLLNNGFIFVGLSIFDPLMLHRLGVSVGHLKIRDSVSFLTVALSAPLMGYMLDRFGPRPVMVVGMSLMAIGMAAYSLATTITEIYLIHFLFGLCLVSSGLFANLVLVSMVTDRHRGLAVGFILAAASLGKAIAPRIDVVLLSHFGLRTAFLAVAGASLLVVPAILLCVPRLGSNARRVQDQTAPPWGVSVSVALRGPTVWLLGLIAAIGFFSELGVVSNMVLLLDRQRHLGRDTASAVLFVLFIAVILTQLGAGFLADRIRGRWVQACPLLLMVAGTVAMLGQTPAMLWTGVLCFGLGWGGTYALLQYLSTRLFAGSAIGRILGLIAQIEAVGAAMGPGGVGLLYDRTGSYVPAFLLVAALLTLAAVVALFITPAARR